jgi:hypothetical protein
MPAFRMSMFLSNNRPTANQIKAYNANNASLAAAPKAPSVLHAPMISRIHNIQPGCGSCGRH